MIGLRQRGQAITETIVSMSVIVVFFLWATTFYVLNQSTIDATMGARLSVWYQSLFGSASGLSETQIRANAEELVGDVYVEKRTDSSRRFANTTCVNSSDCYVVGRVNADGAWVPGVTTVAGTSINPTYTYPSSRSSSIARRLGLDDDSSPASVRSEVVSIPVNPNLSLLESTRLTSAVASYGGDGSPALGFERTRLVGPGFQPGIARRAALLSNTGVLVPDNDEQYQEFVSDLAADGAPLSVFEPFRATLAGFDEVHPTLRSNGLTTAPAQQSTVLPQELGGYPD